MPLSEAQRVRYARQLLLPELGERGQLRLLAGRVRFVGVEEGAQDVAGEYLRRAGVSVSVSEDAHAQTGASVDAKAVVEGDGDGDESATALLLSPPRLSTDPALTAAAEALSGAFTAVEAIKRLAGIGKAAELDRDLLRAEEV